jgi:hypothetical protein
MNSKNLGARIRRNEALDQKIWALEDYRGKMVFSGGSMAFLRFLEWLEGLGTNDSVFGKFSWIFMDFWECLKGLRA